MKKMVVSAKRDFQVRSKSVLNDTHLARKTTTATGTSEWEAFETTEEYERLVSAADRLKAANEIAEAKAKSEAKTSSPWTDIETAVSSVMKMKKLPAQVVLDMLIENDFVTIPEFTEAPDSEEVEDDDENGSEEVSEEVVS